MFCTPRGPQRSSKALEDLSLGPPMDTGCFSIEVCLRRNLYIRDWRLRIPRLVVQVTIILTRENLWLSNVQTFSPPTSAMLSGVRLNWGRAGWRGETRGCCCCCCWSEEEVWKEAMPGLANAPTGAPGELDDEIDGSNLSNCCSEAPPPTWYVSHDPLWPSSLSSAS